MKTPARTLYATLIGINQYPNPGSQLNGCIKDVLGMDGLLREWGVQQGRGKQGQSFLAYKPLYLLAPNESDQRAISEYVRQFPIDYQAPTFANITGQAFKHLKQAQDGDICLFYYSGHGSHIEAPDVFPNRQHETLVCVDSRTTARDLIDKELAFLLWDALRDPATGREKDVHCVVIMDCCFAGNNTRGEDEVNSPVLFRHQLPTAANIPLEDYLGFDKAGTFYTVQNGQANIKIARYVHLGAGLNTEKSQETAFDGGLFTSKLLETLRAGGTARSYRDLVNNLTISVRNRAGQQNPVAFSREDKDLDQLFLGAGIVPYKPTFEVRYDVVQNQWIMYGGGLQGIVPGTSTSQTLVQISGSARQIPIRQFAANFSVLDLAPDDPEFDRDREDYQATLVRLASPRIAIGLSDTLLESPALLAALQTAYEKTPPLFFEINFEQNPGAMQYLIQFTADDQYVLTRLNSIIPLFKREKEAAALLFNIDSVSKWLHTSDLKHLNSSFSKGDFIFKLEKITGKPETGQLNHSNLDDPNLMFGRIADLQEEEVFQYVNGKQPAFRLTMAIDPASNLESCYVGALYLSSKFGISSELLRRDEDNLVKGAKPLSLQFFEKANATFYKTIPLILDAGYEKYNINEVTEFLKIFVSNQPIDLQRFVQPELALDITSPDKHRSIRLADNHDQTDQTDWAVFTTTIKLVGPNKEKPLIPGTSVWP